MSKHDRTEIAVVGMACRFPGDVHDASSFWRFLLDGGDGIRDVPEDRWSVRRFHDADPATPGKAIMRRGGFLGGDFGAFDPLFFGISPREAAYMDPQQRLLLEVAHEAMEDAGLVPARLAGGNVGVYVGGFALDHLIQLSSPLSRSIVDTHHTATAAAMTMLAARIAYTFDFRGPAIAIDTACSSSLVALHYAARALQTGECDAALAGGVNMMISPQYPIVMSKGHFLAPDGHCKSFDARADGYSRGEGAGLVMLKRLEDALADGDPIQAVLVATGVNQDGHTNGITVPSAEAQARLVREVAAAGGVDLADIAYVEAHGTGTPVGDPLEARALAETIGSVRAAGHPVVIGSVKANIGHLEAAAGVAGFIKACLVAQNRLVPPQARLGEPNPAIPFADWGLALPRVATPIEPETFHVAVNSFGYGGTNAHALLKPFAAPDVGLAATPRPTPAGTQFLKLTARTEPALAALAAAYRERIAAAAPGELPALCYSAGAKRSDFEHRAVVFGDNPQAFITALDALSSGEAAGDVVVRPSSGTDAPTAWVFSGMGPQWWGMGRRLLAEDAAFRAAAEAADTLFAGLSGWSILAEMARDEATSRMGETQIAQPANFVVQIGLAALLSARGFRPAAIVGHSVGEVSAAYVSGALSLEDAVLVSYHRSRLQQTTAGTGTMLAVGLSQADAQARIAPYDGRVSIGAVNGAQAITLSGESAALDEIAQALEAASVFHRFLRVEVPYHSPQMDVLKAPLAQALDGLRPTSPRIPLYSTVTGARFGADERHDADYWFRNVRAPVLFARAVEAMIADGYGTFLEVGPNPVLTSAVRTCAAGMDRTVESLYTLRRQEDETLAVRRMIADLITAGAAVDWACLAGTDRYARLPTYPFQREVHWAESAATAADRLGRDAHPLLGAPLEGPAPVFEADVSVNYMPWLPDHRIEGDVVFPAAAYVEAALAAHAALEGEEGAVLEGLDLRQAMLVDPDRRFPLRWSFEAATRTLTAATRPGRDGDWRDHASVRVLAARPWTSPAIDLPALEVAHGEIVDVEALYAGLAARGLDYGPSFRTIRALRRTAGSVLAELAVHEAHASEALAGRLHPTLLDGAFQALIAACADRPGASRLFMPVGIRRVLYHRPAGTAVRALGTIRRQDETAIEGDIRLVAADGSIVADIFGFACRAVATARDAAPSLDRWLFSETWVPAEPVAAFARDGRWLVLTDGGALADRLSATLDRQGAREILVLTGAEVSAGGLAAIGPADLDAVIDLRPAEADGAGDPAGIDHVEGLAALVKALSDAEVSPRLYLVTRGYRPADGTAPAIDQAGAAGTLRVVALERPDLRPTLVDLDADLSPATLRRLGAEIVADGTEDEVVLRGTERLVARIARMPGFAAADETPVAVSTLADDVRFRLDTGAGGSFEALGFRESERRAPGDGEVELAVLSAALNFKDVLKVLGVLPKKAYENTFFGETLGMEAAAVVTAVGAGVTRFAVGQRVVAALPDCLASHVTIAEDRLFALDLPAGASGPESATIPVAFMTAWYALHELARLKPGERVLIHAATGGVGLAAIQIAQRLGAEIHATAGNPEKREHLRALGVAGIYDSRSLAFAEEIRTATGGRGVDVVLNSLSGDVFQATLPLLAPFGRFVEIGKRDIMENGRIPMGLFNENLSFSSVDLDRLMAERPAVVAALLADVARLMREGVVTPLPVTRFKVADLPDALRHMAQARHIGKIVVDFEDRADLSLVPRRRSAAAVRPDAASLVTGAFGGFGLELCRSLVARGCRHLVMAGRSGAASEAARAALAEFASLGVHVIEGRLDVADRTAVDALLGELDAAGVPLAGVYHAAAVLDDGLVDHLDPARIARVMRPKALGALTLHEATLGRPLDVFMLFSSATALIGNPGQASYVAANAVLDALARRRRAEGLPATAVAWGAIGGAGMLADDGPAARQLELAGVRRIPVKRAIAALDAVLAADLPGGALAVMDIDVATWSGLFPQAREIPRFSALMAEDAPGCERSGAAATLAALDPADRLPAVVEGITGVVAGAMKMPAARIPADRPLSDLGIDSLIGVELQSALGQRYGVQISLLQLSKGASVTDLARSVLKRFDLDLDLDPGAAGDRLAA
ncbi:type I polyketide synthase [Aureimonas pseudogalii]|uniref:type I polyketide synthase n=1 Tax=Aureimonas pseudogalii TaxID=1744844 RepID=UPI0035E796FC